MADGGGETERTNWTEEQLVMRFIGKMIDAKANNDIPAYFTYFEGAFGMLLAYMPVEVQKENQEDYNNYLMKTIETQKNTNDMSKTNDLNNLMKNFADSKRVFIFKALQYRGWQKPEIEGELNWKDITPEELAALVRTKNILKSGANIEPPREQHE